MISAEVITTAIFAAIGLITAFLILLANDCKLSKKDNDKLFDD